MEANRKIGLIIKESIDSFLAENSSTYNTEVYYRGYCSKYGPQRCHLLWITDDIEYAMAYGDTVDEVTIDIDKLKLASMQDIENILGHDFDYVYGLSEPEAKEVIENGYNAYGFEANNDESYCICLLDKTPIVRRKTIKTRKRP